MAILVPNDLSETYLLQVTMLPADRLDEHKRSLSQRVQDDLEKYQESKDIRSYSGWRSVWPEMGIGRDEIGARCLT